MNVRKLSVNKACIFLAVLLLAAMVTVSVALYALTQDITAVWYVLLFGIFVLFCSICFMVLVRRKLAMFSDPHIAHTIYRFDVLTVGCFDFVSYPADSRSQSVFIHKISVCVPQLFQQDLPCQNNLWIGGALK